MQQNQEPDHQCHVCQKQALLEVVQFPLLGRVASDCRPWPSGGHLAICTHCGIVQKIVNDVWRQEISEIYNNYHLYHQSDSGHEQRVFNQETGTSTPRSTAILHFLIKSVKLPTIGSMLDIGCGNGAMLQACSTLLGKWQLNGFDPNLKNRDKILEIPGVHKAWDGLLDNIPNTFDFMSLIHVLEHIENPIHFLLKIRQKLKPQGILLIQVPYFVDNPFDLLIADHCSHFDMQTCITVLQNAGLELIDIQTNIIDKEISVLAKVAESFDVGQAPSFTSNPNVVSKNNVLVNKYIHWLNLLSKDAREIASAPDRLFGIFGTSIAANWLLGELQDLIKFFVEEDRNRINRSYRTRPVYHPVDVPLDSTVYFSLPRFLAEKIMHRLNTQNISYCLPPAFPSLDE